MSGRWADRPLAPRCSTKSPQIPHGSRLLFSIWATLSCRPTPAPAVRLKLHSSDGPDPARAPRTGSIQRNSLHRDWHLAADRGRLTGYAEVIRVNPTAPLLPACRPLAQNASFLAFHTANRDSWLLAQNLGSVLRRTGSADSAQHSRTPCAEIPPSYQTPHSTPFFLSLSPPRP